MWHLYGLVLIAGALNAVQSGANAALGKSLGQPLMAALVIVAVSATSLLVVGLVSGQIAWPEPGRAAAVPWWAWLGGMMGALFVMSQLLVAGKIGAGAFMGVSVTAAVIASIALDHFGLVGFEPHPAGVARFVGGALMIGGVILVALG